MPAGRPTSYKPEYAEQAAKLCALGATDAELADFFKVTTVTIWRWQSAHVEFCNALKRGKEAADERVERSLYARATGYTHEAVKIFMPAGAKKPVYAKYQEHVPPDVTAQIFWLKNRRREEWRDKQEHEHTGKDGAALVPIINLTGRPEPSSAS
ncbi:helix-turn-helix domain-containing protein [Bradyrhizobium sp. vgs-9]|uniref:helix-turn-helix domain-containing protein n=1 Tax=Bradyrhizobium sp. vgs-9 TaxID=208389 RepID=UPI0035D3D9CA